MPLCSPTRCLTVKEAWLEVKKCMIIGRSFKGFGRCFGFGAQKRIAFLYVRGVAGPYIAMHLNTFCRHAWACKIEGVHGKRLTRVLLRSILVFPRQLDLEDVPVNVCFARSGYFSL